MAEAPVFDIDEFLKATSRSGASAPAAPAGNVPFYNRPIPVPKGVRTAGNLLRRGVGPAAAVGTALAVGEFMKESIEPAVVNAMAGPGPMTPELAAQVRAAGGTDAFVRGVQSRAGTQPPTAAPAATPAAAPAAAPTSDTLDPAAILNRSVAAPRGMGAIQASGAPARLVGGTGPEVTLPPVRYQPRTSVGSFFQAGADMKVMANTQAAGERREKLLLDAITKAPAARKAALEARLLGTRAAAVDAMVNAGVDPGEIARATTGGDVSSRFSVPPGAILTPGQPVPTINNRTGEVELRTPRTRAQVGPGTDGKMYILDAQGKPVRPATASELAQLRK